MKRFVGSVIPKALTGIVKPVFSKTLLPHQLAQQRWFSGQPAKLGPIGSDFFKELRLESDVFIDKSMLIKDVLEAKQ